MLDDDEKRWAHADEPELFRCRDCERFAPCRLVTYEEVGWCDKDRTHYYADRRGCEDPWEE